MTIEQEKKIRRNFNNWKKKVKTDDEFNVSDLDLAYRFLIIEFDSILADKRAEVEKLKEISNCGIMGIIELIDRDEVLKILK